MIIVVGIGPGDSALRLTGTEKYIAQADVVIGSARQLEAFPQVPEAKQKVLPHLAELQDYLQANAAKQIVLLASGDPLLYGIGTWVSKHFPTDQVKIIPGISSIQYLFHQLQLSMNDCYLTSSHGRKPDFDFLLRHEKVGMVTDQDLGPYEIAQEIRRRGQHRHIYVGERLSYPDERISEYDEQTVENRDYGMNVVIITNA